MSLEFDTMLPAEEEYWCEVMQYIRSHSTLAVKFTKAQTPSEYFYVEFSSIQYFSGSISWTSNKFEKAPYQECLDILERLYGFNKALYEKPLNEGGNLKLPSYNLYRSVNAQLPTQIIARRAHLFAPDEYRI